MKKLHSSKEFKWLKTLHVFSACMWGGAAVALVMVQLCIHPVTGDELHLRDLCMKVIDDCVVIPGAFGCLLTGFVYAMLTKWGFFKYIDFHILNFTALSVVGVLQYSLLPLAL
jgi:hypothetical protein